MPGRQSLQPFLEVNPLAGHSTPNELLTALLADWQLLLQGWASSGRLTAAAQEALLLNGVPQALKELVAQWSAGVFTGIPPIVLMPASAMPGAAGAYAISTGNIYLNQDWLAEASAAQVIAVLTEELGHHLDGLLNVEDTPGDEGAIFAAVVLGQELSASRLAQLKAEDDHKIITLNDEVIAIEQANTVNQPYLVADINQTSFGSSPSNFIKVGGILYFTANDDINGSELWKADPATGVVSLLEVNPGNSSSSISNLTDVNGTLYFQAYDNTNGYELWKVGTNGTPTRIDLGSGSSSPNYLTNVNGTLYFTGGGLQWRELCWK